MIEDLPAFYEKGFFSRHLLIGIREKANTMKRQAVVVVPVYTEQINQFEQISLLQVFSILGEDYNIVAVAPRGLKADYLNRFPKIQFFDASYFRSIKGYSELLTSVEFYSRFEEYEYILIYQLDAFVFSNRLQEFCEKGYSYIGAVVGNALWGHFSNHVGNGGFSLRKVDSFLGILKRRQYYVEQIEKNFSSEIYEYIMKNEDQFWAYCAQVDGATFTVPDMEYASEFSIEANINNSFDTLKKGLPFGCHRWYKANFEIWWPIISDYGYKMDANSILLMTHYGTEYIRAAFRADYQGNLSDEMKNNMPLERRRPISIWGAGVCGEHCYMVLKDCGYVIKEILDKRLVENVWDTGHETIYPDKESVINNLPIIISTYKYKNDVIRELVDMGLEKDKDFYCWTEVETKWLELNGLNVEIV